MPTAYRFGRRCDTDDSDDDEYMTEVSKKSKPMRKEWPPWSSLTTMPEQHQGLLNQSEHAGSNKNLCQMYDHRDASAAARGSLKIMNLTIPFIQGFLSETDTIKRRSKSFLSSKRQDPKKWWSSQSTISKTLSSFCTSGNGKLQSSCYPTNFSNSADSKSNSHNSVRKRVTWRSASTASNSSISCQDVDTN